MAMYYIIARKVGENLYVEAIDSNENFKNSFSPYEYEFSHWDTDICGDVPKISSVDPWIDTRTYIQKRKSGYKMEVDSAYFDYQGQLADGADDATAKQVWLSARNAIRSKYPKP